MTPYSPSNPSEQSVGPDSITPAVFVGRACTAFTVHSGDVVWFDKANSNIGPGGKLNERAEYDYGSEKVTPDSGRRIYEWSVAFGEGFPANHRWAMVFQFHGDDKNPKPGFSGISIHGGNLDAGIPFADIDKVKLGSIPLVVGQWYDMRLDIFWSAGPDGYVKWYSGATLLGEYHGPVCSPNTFYYLKQGYYRDGTTPGTGIVYETPITISDGSEIAPPVILPPAPPVPAPVPLGLSAKAQAGLDLLVALRARVQKEITSARMQAAASTTAAQALQSIDDDIKVLLDKGPWTP